MLSRPLIPHRAVPWLVGGGALGLGMWLYLPGVDRSGAFGGWLPSLVHPLAFSLFSAALMAARPCRDYGVCAFWFAVNAAFEVGQHRQIRGPLADALREAMGDSPLSRRVANYFLHGTFDGADLIASAAGAVLAAVILQRLRIHTESRHVP